jgi:hypothetical protein
MIGVVLNSIRRPSVGYVPTASSIGTESQSLLGALDFAGVA